MCVPLEPGMPPERVDSILRQSGAAIVVDEQLLDQLLEASAETTTATSARSTWRPSRPPMSSSHPGRQESPRASSGLTPRWVPTPMIIWITCCGRWPRGWERPLRIAHAWSFAFDAAWQPLVALLDGHAVHVVDEHTQTDAEALVQVIAEHRITT